MYARLMGSKGMTDAIMARKRVTYRLDETLIQALKSQAKSDNSSANNWLENLLIKGLKEAGAIDDSYEPLVETRGGPRTTPEGKAV